MLTYLTVEELKSYTSISNNVDTSQLESWIPISESMRIVPVLGTALDTSLKAELEATGTLTGNSAILYTHIKNCSAWYSFYEASTFMRTKAMNKGIIQQFSDNSQVAPLEDFRQYRQDILDKAQFYLNYLVQYLEDNKNLFPLYRSQCDDYSGHDYTGSGIYV